MGYEIFAFVAPKGPFDEIKSRSPYVTVAAINQGFELMLNDWHLEAVLPHQIDESENNGFGYSLLNQSLIDMCLKFSERHTIAYVLADFFGGVGSQFGVAWKDRQIISLPQNNHVFGGVPGLTTIEDRMVVILPDKTARDLSRQNGPINTVLRAIGVQATETADEFDTVGLSRYREREDWFIAATGFDRKTYDPDTDY